MEHYFELETALTKRNLKEVNALSVREVAKVLGCIPATVSYYLRMEKLRGFKLGNRWRVDPRELQAFMDRRAA